MDSLQHTLVETLENHNDILPAMDLVLFEDAILHVWVTSEWHMDTSLCDSKFVLDLISISALTVPTLRFATSQRWCVHQGDGVTGYRGKKGDCSFVLKVTLSAVEYSTG